MVAAPAGHAPAAPRGVEAEVGAALDGIRSARHRFVAPVLLGFIMLFDSWDSIAIAYVMPSLVKDWGLSPVAAGSLISSSYAGQFIGALLLGSLAERFGRMPVFMVAVTWMALLAIASAAAPGFELLFGLRLIQGVAIGGALPVAITYINELAPTASRGRYFSLYQWIAMSGYGIAAIASAVIVPHLGWRWMFAIGGVPLLMVPLVAWLLPESPRWLARAGRTDAALAALRKLGDRTTTGLSAPLPPAVEEPKSRFAMAALFRAQFRSQTLVIMAIWFFTYFANFGLVTWAPSIYVTVFNVPIEAALRYGAIGTAIGFFLTPAIGVLIDVVGRRPIAIVSTGGAALTMLWLALLPPSGVLLIVVLVMLGKLFIAGAATIVWPYTAEIYPTRVRAVALGVNSSVARFASTVTPMTVGVILGSGGSISLVFGLFGICAAAALTLWVIATRETRSASLDED